MKQKGNNFFKIEMLILSYLSQRDLYEETIIYEDTLARATKVGPKQ